MRAAPIAMIQQFIQRFFCDRFAPLLTAYVEGGLDEKRRVKVAGHINTCAACRQEVEQLAELGKLLRANPPAVPQLKPDLWSRIQAEITAESAAQPELPAARPLPRRQPATGFQWSSFGISFASAGTLVAAGVVGVVVMTQSLVHRPVDTELPMKKSGESLAIAPAEREAISVTFVPALKPVRGPEPKAKAAVVVPAMVATADVRPSRPVRARQIAMVRRRERFSNRSETVAVTRPLRVISAPAKPFYSVALAEKKENARTMVAEPETPALPDETPAAASATDRAFDVAMATPETSDSKTLDEVVAPREVPASGFVNDSAKLRARQILFVYSGR